MLLILTPPSVEPLEKASYTPEIRAMPRIEWTHGLTITDDAAARRFKETGWLIPTPIWRDTVEEAEREDFRRQGLPI